MLVGVRRVLRLCGRGRRAAAPAPRQWRTGRADPAFAVLAGSGPGSAGVAFSTEGGGGETVKEGQNGAAQDAGALAALAAAQQRHVQIKGRRRFYQRASVVHKEGAEDGGAGYEVLLDGRALKTPGRNRMLLPTEGLAWAIAAEWDAQAVGADGDTTDDHAVARGIEPASMPVMSLVATALDQVLLERDVVEANCLKYLQTDTLCFLADEDDRILRKKQLRLYTPLHDWMQQQMGMDVSTTERMVGTAGHNPVVMDQAAAALAAMDHWTLTALQSITMECKSLILALAAVSNRVDAEEAGEIARCEEEFQIGIWGVIEGGHHDLDRVNTRVRLGAASLFLHLLYPSAAERAAAVNVWVAAANGAT